MPKGLANGTDPEHPEYWGTVNDRDQRMVELAAIGFALALVPQQVWEPLDAERAGNLAAYLKHARSFDYADNNWKFFRVLVDLGLERIGVEFDRSLTERLSRRSSTGFYLGDGWYRDGNVRRIDHYIPFAMHFYGLIYAKLRRGRRRGEAAIASGRGSVRQGYPALVRRGWRHPRLRAEPDLSLCLRRLLGGARLCRRRGAALGRDQGAVPAAPALVGRQADRQSRRHAVDRLRLSQPLHVRELQFGRLALLGAQGLPAAGAAGRPSVLDGRGEAACRRPASPCRSSIPAW